MMKKLLLILIGLYLVWALLFPNSWFEAIAIFFDLKIHHLQYKIGRMFTVSFLAWVFVLFVLMIWRTWRRN